MSKPHNHVYQMIRFLVQGYNRIAVAESEFFSELAMKTLIMTHDHHCDISDRFADCVMAIIEDM